MTATPTSAPIASVNGIALHGPDEVLDAAALRQRACTELLRQAAQQAGLLALDDPANTDGVPSAAASDAIEQLLGRELRQPEPDEDACRRHYAAHLDRHRQGDRVRLRHILFAVTPGVDVRRLRDRAEHALLALRCDDADLFARQAAELSNCPSGAAGGDLGWLRAADCAPEFAREVFSGQEVGVLPRLVHSRFGLHVVEVLERRDGRTPSFASVRPAVEAALRRQAFGVALRQYLRVLAGGASLHGVDLEAADSPLVA